MNTHDDCLFRNGKNTEVFVVHCLGTVIFGVACVCSVVYAFLQAYVQGVSILNILAFDWLFHLLPFLFFVVIFRSFTRFFWKYRVDPKGITVFRPFAKSITFSWKIIQKIDVAMVGVNRKEDVPVIRVFYGSTKRDWGKKQAFEVALASWDPVLLISYSEERITELRSFYPDIIQD